MSNGIAVHLKVKYFLLVYMHLNTDRYYSQFRCPLVPFWISMESVLGFQGRSWRAAMSRWWSCPVGGVSHPLKHRHRLNAPLAFFCKTHVHVIVPYTGATVCAGWDTVVLHCLWVRTTVSWEIIKIFLSGKGKILSKDIVFTCAFEGEESSPSYFNHLQTAHYKQCIPHIGQGKYDTS